jgi:hypothetical protein
MLLSRGSQEKVVRLTQISAGDHHVQFVIAQSPGDGFQMCSRLRHLIATASIFTYEDGQFLNVGGDPTNVIQ